MKYTKIISILLLSFIWIGQASAQQDEKIVKKAVPVEDFLQLLVSGQYNIVLQSGTHSGLILEGPEKVLDAIHAEVKAGTLMVYTTRQIDPETRITAHITYVDLRKMKIAGAVTLHAKSPMIVESMHLDASGASDIKLSFETKVLALLVSGDAKLELDGQTESLSTNLSGMAQLKAYGLSVASADIIMSGSSAAEINVVKSIVANLSGQSKLTYDGTPTISENITGGASMKLREKE